MARINFDDNVESQPEFRRLLKLVGGDDDRARGMLVRWFRLAQQAFGRDLGVTRETLEQHDLVAMIESGWAVDCGEGLQVKGADKHFAWYRQRVASSVAGGKARANAPRDERGRLQPDSSRTPAGNDVPTAGLQPASSPLSLAPSLSLSKIQNKESIGDFAAGESRAVAVVADLLGIEEQDRELFLAASENAVAGVMDAAAKSLAKASEKQRAAAKANRFVAAYVIAYQTRFPGGRPEDLNDPKIRGQIIGLAKDYPIERLCELIQVYFQLEAKWFGTKGYDFLTFRNNLQKIGQALDSGKDPDGNSVDWAKVFA